MLPFILFFFIILNFKYFFVLFCLEFCNLLIVKDVNCIVFNEENSVLVTGTFYLHAELILTLTRIV